MKISISGFTELRTTWIASQTVAYKMVRVVSVDVVRTLKEEGK